MLSPTLVGNRDAGIIALALTAGSGTGAFNGSVTSFPIFPVLGKIGNPMLGFQACCAGFGGVSPYTYAVTTGTLPAGLALNTSSGVISGTPTTAGTSAFTITATDAHAVTVNRAFSVVISSTGGGSYAFVT